jgi:hypothetical protein
MPLPPVSPVIAAGIGGLGFRLVRRGGFADESVAMDANERLFHLQTA